MMFYNLSFQTRLYHSKIPEKIPHKQIKNVIIIDLRGRDIPIASKAIAQLFDFLLWTSHVW